MMAVAAFTAFVLLGNVLTAETAFTALALFDILKMPMLDLGWIVGSMVKAYIALSRVSAYLSSPELETEGYAVHEHPAAAGSTDCAVKITDGSFSWGEGRSVDMDLKEIKKIGADLDKALQVGAISDSRHTAMMQALESGGRGTASMVGFKLQDISLSLRAGELLAVVGSVGAGKTSLLHAILGEMVLIRPDGAEGTVVERRGSIAYAGQTPFIVNASVKENILFGSPYDAKKYQQTLDVCCLRSDLKILPQGDLSEIGEQGINLSGCVFVAGTLCQTKSGLTPKMLVQGSEGSAVSGQGSIRRHRHRAAG